MSGNRRLTRSELTSVVAECKECPWKQNGLNGLPLAARHHDTTGHEVDIDIGRRVTYGKAITPEELGQLGLADAGEPTP